ncbi:MAG: polymorphic toxin-type HINT domain-containing protein, partial [Limisphaerales bacterium]
QLKHGNGTTVLRATDEHLIWVDGKGWVPAKELTTGDWLFDERGRRVQVTENRLQSYDGKVFTLKLRGDNVFYANGVLVHDMCGREQMENVTAEVLK